jgi:hypothetical protein
MNHNEIREEFKKKFVNWKIHHKTTPCLKDEFVINEIADWWLDKFSSLKQELLLEIGEDEEIYSPLDSVRKEVNKEKARVRAIINKKL